jgi:hypothetical protein
MRFFQLLSLLSLLAFTTGSAEAASQLFKVFKPINPENVLLISVNINNSDPSAADFCKPKDLDFIWIMSHGRPDQSTKRSIVEGRIRKKFPISRVNPANKASCQSQNAQPGTCAAISIRAEEFNWVQHGLADPSLVVKAVKQGNRCGVGAFLDAGEKGVVMIKSLNAAGQVLQSPSLLNHSATIKVHSLTVEASDGRKEVYRCSGACVQKITF